MTKSTLHLAVASALLLVTAGTAQAQPKTACKGTLSAYKSKNQQIKAETQKWKTAFRNLETFYKLSQKDFNRYATQDSKFAAEFTKLGNEVASVLGVAYIDDVVLSGGGVVAGTATLLGTTYNIEAISGANTPPTLGTATFVAPFDIVATITGATTVAGKPIDGAGSYANFLYGDPTTPGLTPTEVSKITHSHQVLLQKLVVDQSKIKNRRKAVNLYSDKRFKAVSAKALKLTRLLAALQTESTKLFGAAGGNGTTIADPADFTFTRAIAAGDPSLWGARNSLYLNGLNQCDPVKYPLPLP